MANTFKVSAGDHKLLTDLGKKLGLSQTQTIDRVLKAVKARETLASHVGEAKALVSSPDQDTIEAMAFLEEHPDAVGCTVNGQTFIRKEALKEAVDRALAQVLHGGKVVRQQDKPII